MASAYNLLELLKFSLTVLPEINYFFIKTNQAVRKAGPATTVIQSQIIPLVNGRLLRKTIREGYLVLCQTIHS